MDRCGRPRRRLRREARAASGTRAARPLAGEHHEVPGECERGTGRAGRRTFPAGPERPAGRRITGQLGA